MFFIALNAFVVCLSIFVCIYTLFLSVITNTNVSEKIAVILYPLYRLNAIFTTIFYFS